MPQGDENNLRTCLSDEIYIHTVRQAGKMCGQEHRTPYHMQLTVSIKPLHPYLCPDYQVIKNLTLIMAS